LPISPVPPPEPGEGGIFVEKKYNIFVTSIATFFLVAVIVLVYLSEQKRHRLGTDVVPMTNNQTRNKDDNEEIPVI
jgi:hypothetical protein